jgi:hypothetical protein
MLRNPTGDSGRVARYYTARNRFARGPEVAKSRKSCSVRASGASARAPRHAGSQGSSDCLRHLVAWAAKARRATRRTVNRRIIPTLASCFAIACSSTSSTSHDHGSDASVEAEAVRPSCEKLHLGCESATEGKAEECHNLAHSATATEAQCLAALDGCLAVCAQTAPQDAGTEDVSVEPAKDAAAEGGECKKSGAACTNAAECCSKDCHSHGGPSKECH